MFTLQQISQLVCLTPRVRLYIDPGTGSMLFAVLIGLLGVGRFLFKGLWVKLRFLFSGGKKTDADNDVIPLAVFSDDKRYWSVFEPILRELDQRGFDVVYMTASEDDPGLKTDLSHVKAECIGPGNHAFAKLNFTKATMLLSTTPGLDVYQWKRSKDVKYYIHIPHSPAELTTYRMFGTDYYDAMMLSGQYQIDDARELEKLRDLPAKELTLVGIPFLDEKVKRLEAFKAQNKDDDTKHERTVLLAPSWGESAILKRYGGDMIRRLLDTGYHIIIRPHPQSFTSEKDLMDKLMQEFPESDRLEWNRDNDNFDVLNRSDIMISDFSGVIFEFALVFDKPVICADTEFDSSPYDAWWLGRLPWGQTAIPRIGKILTKDNFSEIKNMIDTCIEDKSFEESRHAVRDETWTHRGEGARLAADYITEKYKELKTTK
ncbi:MAG: CDP-glycerol glycerophosphotransferase family protein [Clostridiales bacterium]|nr:CDP-glycerol glycerophosphotransferase family protein [Clostridiales bacterium]